jgi:hypothetical protein
MLCSLGAAAPMPEYEILYSIQIFPVSAPSGPSICTHSPSGKSPQLLASCNSAAQQPAASTHAHAPWPAAQSHSAGSRTLRLQASPIHSSLRLYASPPAAFTVVLRSAFSASPNLTPRLPTGRRKSRNRKQQPAGRSGQSPVPRWAGGQATRSAASRSARLSPLRYFVSILSQSK